jgi:hypothetical protein
LQDSSFLERAAQRPHRVVQPGFDRPRRDTQTAGDLGDGQAAEVRQHQHLTVRMGQITERLPHKRRLGNPIDRGLFSQILRDLRVRDDLEMPAAPPKVIRRGVLGDPEDPGPFRSALWVVLVVPPPCANHRLGDHLFGVAPIIKTSQCPGENGLTVIRAELPHEHLGSIRP